MSIARGSMWRRWDLHIHTPESHVHGYGAGNEAWDRFLDDVEALPSDFKVIGVNDYLFLDGYKRMVEEKRNGRLGNIETLLPVIELRLNRFGGSKSKLSKVNYHVIFSDEVPVDQIEQQFIQSLSRTVQLGNNQTWNAPPSRTSLAELGKMIKASVPPDKVSEYGSDLDEGFNGFSVSLEKVRDLLSRHVFVDRHLTAVGKTEWADIKWNDQSIADKKDIINGCDLVFIAAESATAFREAQQSLTHERVMSKLVDCSDAHHFSSSSNKDRLGNTWTWISADPTFEGLRHAQIEYDRRIFVGSVPPKVLSVRERPGQHIDRLTVGRTSSAPSGAVGPSAELDLNPGFVAIIGKKGMGKSAIVDILGLVGDSPHSESFSFLSSQRFREPRANPARHFEAELVWASGSTVRKSLDDVSDRSSHEKVRYLPHSLLEQMCAAEGSAAADRFESELGSVIFSHVPSTERLDATNLQQLLEVKTSGVAERIDDLRVELSRQNREIDRLERELQSGRISSARASLVERRRDLASHDESKPIEPSPLTDHSTSPAAQAISNLIDERNQIRAAIDDQSNALRDVSREHTALRTLRESLEALGRHIENATAAIRVQAEAVGLEHSDLISVEVNFAPVDEAVTDAESRRSLLTPEAIEGGGEDRLTEIESEIANLQDQLDEPRRKLEDYRHQIEQWEELRTKILGDADTDGSIGFFERVINDVEAIPGQLEQRRTLRVEVTKEIHAQLSRMTDVYREVHEPVQQFIDTHPLAREKFELNFDVALAVGDLADQFFGMVDRVAAGSFRGVEEGAQALGELLAEANFDLASETVEFVEALHQRVQEDFRDTVAVDRNVTDQLRKGFEPHQLYDLIFGLSYLQPRYELESHGESINLLSPGEKGTLLLMFYLLVDRDSIPLLLDQPEENLDNETIKELLVPALQEAADRRQIVVVTHNPNLAVVGDADQIVVAGHDSTAFNYVAGSIENPTVNQSLVQVLEGSWPAFHNRRLKYWVPRG